ncbi:hypothetical protein PG991_009372 [Apiospora marii]|uniref:Uncharacterized protein n=1 Tax=Apiospora marii TaxID=335849 RepID=A0ABR1RKH8_9PEZI
MKSEPASMRDLAASPLLQGLEHPHALFPRVGTIQRLNGRPRSSTERAVHARGGSAAGAVRGWGAANPELDPSPGRLRSADLLLECRTVGRITPVSQNPRQNTAMSRLLTSRPKIRCCWQLSVQAHFGPLLHVCSMLDATNLALPRMAMLNKSCFVQNFASVHKCPISAGDTFHYPSSALLSSTYNLYSSTASIHAAMLPSQRYDTQRYGRPRQPRQGRPSAGHATTAPAPAPATAPKTVAPSATQLQPPNQQPLSFPDVPNFFDEEGLDSGPFSPPSPTSGDTRELLRKVNELLGKFEAIQSELAHHNENFTTL